MRNQNQYSTLGVGHLLETASPPTEMPLGCSKIRLPPYEHLADRKGDCHSRPYPSLQGRYESKVNLNPSERHLERASPGVRMTLALKKGGLVFVEAWEVVSHLPTRTRLQTPPQIQITKEAEHQLETIPFRETRNTKTTS